MIVSEPTSTPVSAPARRRRAPCRCGPRPRSRGSPAAPPRHRAGRSANPLRPSRPARRVGAEHRPRVDLCDGSTGCSIQPAPRRPSAPVVQLSVGTPSASLGTASCAGRRWPARSRPQGRPGSRARVRFARARRFRIASVPGGGEPPVTPESRAPRRSTSRGASSAQASAPPSAVPPPVAAALAGGMNSMTIPQATAPARHSARQRPAGQARPSRRRLDLAERLDERDLAPPRAASPAATRTTSSAASAPATRGEHALAQREHPRNDSAVLEAVEQRAGEHGPSERAEHRGDAAPGGRSGARRAAGPAAASPRWSAAARTRGAAARRPAR